jgi:hypothetical protein
MFQVQLYKSRPTNQQISQLVSQLAGQIASQPTG